MMISRALRASNASSSLLLRRLSTSSSPRTVVALGGNALVRPGEEGTPAQQAARAKEAAVHLAAFPKDTELVVTHGNGPQVGEILLRSDLTADNSLLTQNFLMVQARHREVMSLCGPPTP